MAQFVRPTSDAAVGLWTTAPLWSKIDEGSAGGDVITSDNNSTPSNADFGCNSVTDPASSTGHILRARWNKSASGGHVVNAVLQLYEGNPGAGGTLRATLTTAAISEVAQTSTYTLSSGEANAITNYGSLYLRVSRQGDTGGAGGTRRSLVVDFIELQVPSASVSVPADTGTLALTGLDATITVSENPTTTTTIFPALDGFLEATYADTTPWATVDADGAANGTPDTTASNAPVGNGWTTGTYQCVQVFLSFDTSVLSSPASGQIKALLAADDPLHTRANADLGLYAYDWGTNLQNADYRGSASLSGPKATFSVPDGTAASLFAADLADVSHLNLSGATRYVLASTSQATDPETANQSVRAGIALLEWAGSTNDPQLVIESNVWLLRTGEWDDAGVWDDTATWRDTANVMVDMDTGALVLSGQEATITRSVPVAMDAGSLALSGLVAGLTRSVPVPMDAGALALSGLPAAITQAPWLLADGTWNDAGVWNDAATWNDGGAVTIEADAGALALDGQVATITRHVPVAMDAGAIALAGQDATVTLSVVIPMDTATLALDGLDAGLTRSLLLGMDAGSLALSGADAGLTRALRLEMDAGALALAGQDAEIVTAGFIPLETGSIALAGNDLEITRTHILRMDVGTVALTGQDAAITRSLTISMGAGSLALAGNDIAVTVMRTVALDAGEIALVGQDATITTSALIRMDAGAFALTGLDMIIGLVATDTPALRTLSGGESRILSSGLARRSLRSGAQGRSL